MIKRRSFIQQIGAGLAASVLGWPLTAYPREAWPLPNTAANGVRVAFLADAHLRWGPLGRTAADNLIAAVTAINMVQPPLDLVFFLGDLTDAADLRAMALGQEILGTLSAPYWFIPGENDAAAQSAGVPPANHGGLFSFTWQNVHFCGLDTRYGEVGDSGARFRLAPSLHQWLAAELKRLPRELPLVILSHAPLYPLFRPWQWWTAASESLLELMQERSRVMLVHGHVHQNIGVRQGNLCFQGVRATAWPLPDVRLGTPATLPRPAASQGQAGCGWLLLTVGWSGAVLLEDQPWAAG